MSTAEMMLEIKQLYFIKYNYLISYLIQLLNTEQSENISLSSHWSAENMMEKVVSNVMEFLELYPLRLRSSLFI